MSELRSADYRGKVSRDLIVSVIALCPAELMNFRNDLVEIQNVLRNEYSHIEFILVDNGLFRDKVEKLKKELQGLEKFVCIFLSQFYDKEVALTAGIDRAIGDYVVVIEPGIDPTELIPDMINLCRNGAGYVIGQRLNRPRRSIFYRFFSSIFFYFGTRLIGMSADRAWSNFLCMKREVVEAVTKIKRRTRFLRFIGKEIGFSYAVLPYRINDNGEPIKKIQLNDFKQGLNIIISSSDRLLQITSLLAFLIATISFLYIFFALAVWIFYPNVQSGWTSTSAFLAFMFGSLFLIIGVLCQYVGFIANETVRTPLYYCAGEITDNGLFRNYKTTSNVEYE